MAAVDFKQCGTCRQTKPASAFNTNRAKWDGLQSDCRECRQVYDQEHHRREYAQVVFMVNPLGTCQWPGCTESDLDILEIDHIDGGGTAEKKAVGGNKAYLRSILRGVRSVDDLQILCSNHHSKKTRSRESKSTRTDSA